MTYSQVGLTETLRLTDNETRRSWRFNEKNLRAGVIERAEQKRKALNVACIEIVGADGLRLWNVVGERQ